MFNSDYGVAMHLRLIFLVLVGILMRGANGAICINHFVEIEATEEPQIIRSPNYPNRYYNNELCKWLLVTRSQLKVIRFRVLRAEIAASATCGDDYVGMQDGKFSWSSGIKSFCGSVSGSKNYTSIGNEVLVTFKTDGSGVDEGFEMEYWSVPRTFVEFSPVKQSRAHRFLYGLFAIIVSSIGFGGLVIFLVRRSEWFTEDRRRFIGSSKKAGEEEDLAALAAEAVKLNENSDKKPEGNGELKTNIVISGGLYQRKSPVQENSGKDPPSVSA